MCCGKQKAYGLSECIESPDGRDCNHKAVNSNFSFGSGYGMMAESRQPVVHQNGVFGTTPTGDTSNGDLNISGSIVPRRKSDSELEPNDKKRFQYLNNGFYNGSKESTAQL